MWYNNNITDISEGNMGSYVVLDETNFDTTIAKGVTVVDFFATWCMPCKMLSPIIEELARDNAGKAVVAKVDIDLSEDLASEYSVLSVPTIIIFKDGMEVERISGFSQKAKLQNAIDRQIS